VWLGPCKFLVFSLMMALRKIHMLVGFILKVYVVLKYYREFGVFAFLVLLQFGHVVAFGDMSA